MRTTIMRTTAGRGRLALVLAAAGLVGACGGGGEGTDTSAAIADTAAAMAGRADSAAAATVREYTDAELLGFLNAANDGEVEMGRMVEAKATDAQVKAYARRITGEHEAFKKEVDALAAKLGVTPAVPENDEDLVDDHTKAMADLNGKAKGKEFDEAFVEHQKEMHRKVIDEVEDALGRTQNADMKALLEKARTALRAHLEAAEEIEKKFGV
jgi:putative membrane protein